MISHKQSCYKLNIICRFIDVVVLTFIFFFILFIHYPKWDKSFEGMKILFLVQYKSYFLLIVSWLFISQVVKYYKVNEFLKIGSVLKKIFFQNFYFSIILFALSGIKDEHLLTTNETFLFSFIVFIYSIIIKLLIIALIKFEVRNGYFLKNAIIIGRNSGTDSFIEVVNKNSKVIYIDKIFEKYNYDVTDFERMLDNPKLDIVYISLNSDFSYNEIEKIIERSLIKFKKVEYISNTFLDFNHSLKLKYYDTFPVLTYSKYPLDNFNNQLIKRLFDLSFSLIVLVILVPFVFPIISILILIDSGFPIFYKQKRNGLYGKEFLCLKFRTMRASKDNDFKATVKGDSRVTSIGKFLRKTSLDELPQFINVVKGDMSIVGPRPHMISQDEYYTNIINRYTLRHYVKPGITGLAQVKGYRGEINDNKDMELRIRSDIFYVRNWSFLMDIILVIKTAFKMVIGDKNAI